MFRRCASTKAAIVSFTRSLAGLAIKQGVRVNAVAQDPVWTPLIPSKHCWRGEPVKKLTWLQPRLLRTLPVSITFGQFVFPLQA
jgi:NAD(P)-dependent dehydrogenase (short-subunit alcohol dehydrogenase family)